MFLGCFCLYPVGKLFVVVYLYINSILTILIQSCHGMNGMNASVRF